MSDPAFLDTPQGRRIAYHFREGNAPTVVFLGGFLSDMAGTKSLALETHCQDRDQAFLRLDYGGHGASEGEFADGTIGSWRDDALAVIAAVTSGSLVLVGSSMGGWIALLVALALKDRVSGLIGIAAAPDFTDKLMWENFSAAQRREIMEDGSTELASDYSDTPTIITRALIEDGRRHCLLDSEIALQIPVRLIHGMQDEDVPWEWSMRIAKRLAGDDVDVTLVKGGSHSLSGPGDLARLTSILDGLLAIS
ncbi:MAG: alpha/beta hydrolase [Proteobacteria bacterium]|nr:alpha/beta hydrolase [Pseudomonadota bacterium]